MEPGKVDFPCPQRMRRWLDNLRDFVLAIQPLNGSGLIRSDTQRGRLLSVNQAFGAQPHGGGSAYPFQVIDASNEDDGARVRVRVGMVTDFFGATIPTGMTEGDDPPFYLAVNDGDHIYLKVTGEVTLSVGAYGTVISCEVAAAATVPSNDYASGLFYYDLAFVTVNAGPPTRVASVTQLAGGSFGWELSGGAGRLWSLGPP